MFYRIRVALLVIKSATLTSQEEQYFYVKTINPMIISTLVKVPKNLGNSIKNCFIFQQWHSTSLNCQKSVNISYPQQSCFHCLGEHLSGINSLSVCRITGYTYNTIFYLASMIITAKHYKRKPGRGAFTFSKIYR